MRGWVALLLPVFFLRSLVPVGFMPMIAAGYQMQLVLCDAYASVPSMDMPDGMPMDGMDMSASHHPPAHQDHGGCLYGSGPALGAPLVWAPPRVADQALLPASSTPQVSFFEVARRAQSARGPPV